MVPCQCLALFLLRLLLYTYFIPWQKYDCYETCLCKLVTYQPANLFAFCVSLQTGCLFENELCSPYEICVNGKMPNAQKHTDFKSFYLNQITCIQVYSNSPAIFLLILPINSQTHIRITNLHSHLTIYICNQKLVRDHLFSALINKINTRTDRDVTEHIMTDIMFALDYISWKHITDNRGNSVNITLMPFNKRYMLRQHSLVRRVYLSWAQCKLLLKLCSN